MELLWVINRFCGFLQTNSAKYSLTGQQGQKDYYNFLDTYNRLVSVAHISGFSRNRVKTLQRIS